MINRKGSVMTMFRKFTGKRRSLFMYMFLLVTVFFALPANALAQDNERQIRRTLKIGRDEPLPSVAERLSRLFGIPVCAEAGLEQQGPAKPVEQVDLNLEEVSLKEALDAYVERHADYCWVHDATNGMMNIFPRTDALTSQRIEVAKGLTNNTLDELFLIGDRLGFKERGALVSSHRPGSSRGYTNVVTVPAGSFNTGNLFNLVCAQMPGKWGWTIERAKPGDVFWDLDEEEKPLIWKAMLTNFGPFGVPRMGVERRGGKVRDFAERVMDARPLDAPELLHLRTAVCHLCTDEVFELPADERQDIVRSLVGRQTYETLETYLQRLLDKGTPAEKRTAADCLGRGLFSVNSVERLEKLLLSDDMGIRRKAMEGLLCLGVVKHKESLGDLILKGNLEQEDEEDAIKVLKAVDPVLCGKVVQSLLAARKASVKPAASRNYLEILERSNTNAFVSKVESLFLTEPQERLSDSPSRGYLLQALLKHWGLVENKSAAMERARVLAAAPDQEAALPAIILLCQHGGPKEHEFLKKRLQDPSLPEGQATVIRQLIKVVEQKTTTDGNGSPPAKSDKTGGTP